MRITNKSKHFDQRQWLGALRHWAPAPALCVFFIVLPSVVTTACKSSPESEQPSSQAPADPNGLNQALTNFSQQITSSVSTLSVSPGQVLTVPVTVKNTGNNRLASAGKFPITFSYKWFDGGRMLPIEGDRTLLPRPLNPGEQASFNAKVVAPDQGQDLTLKLTLVQEGVAWFMTSGGAPLEIPVKMK